MLLLSRLASCVLALAAWTAVQAQTDSDLSPPPDVNLGSITWNGTETFVPRNLGAQKLQETTFLKTTVYPRGLAFRPNGDLLGTLGNGTTSLMEIAEWKDAVYSTLVRFQYHQYSHEDFSNVETMRQREEDEHRGIFWFFGGPLAIDAKNEIYFNLGACGPNGLYRLKQTDPVEVEKLSTAQAFSSLQFFPADSEDLYATTYSGITKVRLGNADPILQILSVYKSYFHLLNTLVLDENHVIATILLRHGPSNADPGQTNDTAPIMAVMFDREKKGYYVFDLKNWGPMAIRPSDKALFRFDEDAREIRQFTVSF
jgi:hypothetical protein